MAINPYQCVCRVFPTCQVRLGVTGMSPRAQALALHGLLPPHMTSLDWVTPHFPFGNQVCAMKRRPGQPGN